MTRATRRGICIELQARSVIRIDGGRLALSLDRRIGSVVSTRVRHSSPEKDDEVLETQVWGYFLLDDGAIRVTVEPASGKRARYRIEAPRSLLIEVPAKIPETTG